MSYLKPGYWTAELCTDYIITYEQLVEKDSNGINMLDKTDCVSHFCFRIFCWHKTSFASRQFLYEQDFQLILNVMAANGQLMATGKVF